MNPKSVNMGVYIVDMMLRIALTPRANNDPILRNALGFIPRALMQDERFGERMTDIKVLSL